MNPSFNIDRHQPIIPLKWEIRNRLEGKLDRVTDSIGKTRLFELGVVFASLVLIAFLPLPPVTVLAWTVIAVVVFESMAWSMHREIQWLTPLVLLSESLPR